MGQKFKLSLVRRENHLVWVIRMSVAVIAAGGQLGTDLVRGVVSTHIK